MPENFTQENVKVTISLIRSFLHFLSVSKIHNVPEEDITELAGSLIIHLEYIQKAYEKLCIKGEING